MLDDFEYTVQKYCEKRFVILTMFWMITVFTFALFSYRLLISDIEENLGSKAMILALDVAARLELSKDDVTRLVSIDFNQLLRNDLNIKFERQARMVMDHSEAKYIYLEMSLSQSMIRYWVEEGEEDIYGYPVSTPLDVVYLLDAVDSEETRWKDVNGKGYIDKHRYNIMCQAHREVVISGKPSFHVSNDQWGRFITGYAPYYDNEGDYVGLIGVDLYLDTYLATIKKNIYVIYAFVITNIFLCFIAISLSIRLKNAQKQALEKNLLSCTDSLTSILNRRRFIEIFQEVLLNFVKKQKPIALLIVDIDYFKEYNDSYGHLAGDNVIKIIAQLLDDMAKQCDGIVGRYGGDEFMILLPDTDFGKAKQLANAIISRVVDLQIKHDYSPISGYQTVSIGIFSIVPTRGMSIEQIIHCADKALYKAKRYGRNQVQAWDESL